MATPFPFCRGRLEKVNLLIHVLDQVRESKPSAQNWLQLSHGLTNPKSEATREKSFGRLPKFTLPALQALDGGFFHRFHLPQAHGMGNTAVSRVLGEE